MSIRKLVSVITPCYNGEKHIFRLLDSILQQTYPSIEMFVIDDGSTDNTSNIVQSYISKFKSKGYTLSYIYQTNTGQAAAINNGLRLYRGEYLLWPDSDDFYSSPESIEKMVNALYETSNSISMVRTNAIVLDESSLKVLREIKYPIKEDNAFFDCILENNFSLVPGKFLVKSEVLRKELNNNQIYNSRAGQNWQLLLPILWNYKSITIHEYLYTIIERKDSHSRKGAGNVQVELIKINSHEEILKETILRLRNIEEENKVKLLELITLKYKKRKLNLYYAESMKKEFLTTYTEIQKIYPKSLKLKDVLKKTLLVLKIK